MITVPLRLIHSVPRYVAARAKQLGIAQDTYLCLLLGNYVAAKRWGLAYVVERKPLRQPATLCMTLPEPLHAAGIAVATRYDLTFETVMQALIVSDAWSDDNGLPVIPVHSRKPQLTGVR